LTFFTKPIINKNQNSMKDLLWLIVLILLIGWLIGFIGFGQLVGNLIHILIVGAVILAVLGLVRKI